VLELGIAPLSERRLVLALGKTGGVEKASGGKVADNAQRVLRVQLIAHLERIDASSDAAREGRERL